MFCKSSKTDSDGFFFFFFSVSISDFKQLSLVVVETDGPFVQVDVSGWNLILLHTGLGHTDLEDELHPSTPLPLFPALGPVVVGDGSLAG